MQLYCRIEREGEQGRRKEERKGERGKETQGIGREREYKNFYLNLLWGSGRKKKETKRKREREREREMEKERVSLER